MAGAGGPTQSAVRADTDMGRRRLWLPNKRGVCGLLWGRLGQCSLCLSPRAGRETPMGLPHTYGAAKELPVPSPPPPSSHSWSKGGSGGPHPLCMGLAYR